jgi:hypothetical protein
LPQRVNQTVTQAKEAADKARRAAMKFSIWVAIALLAGALSASLAAVKVANCEIRAGMKRVTLQEQEL